MIYRDTEILLPTESATDCGLSSQPIGAITCL